MIADDHETPVPILFTSITGTGLRACVWGPVARNAEDYQKYYQAIANKVCRRWGLESKLDAATYDCSRLCFLPYDPDITFHH